MRRAALRRHVDFDGERVRRRLFFEGALIVVDDHRSPGADTPQLLGVGAPDADRVRIGLLVLDLAGRLDPKTVALVHGETEAKTWMEDNLRFFYPDVLVLRPDEGEPIYL